MPGRTFFLNPSKFITFAAAPLVLTPLVLNQARPDERLASPPARPSDVPGPGCSDPGQTPPGAGGAEEEGGGGARQAEVGVAQPPLHGAERLQAGKLAAGTPSSQPLVGCGWLRKARHIRSIYTSSNSRCNLLGTLLDAWTAVDKPRLSDLHDDFLQDGVRINILNPNLIASVFVECYAMRSSGSPF